MLEVGPEEDDPFGNYYVFQTVACPTEWFIPAAECVQLHNGEAYCNGAFCTGVLCSHGTDGKAQHAPVDSVELDLTLQYVCGLY